MYDMLPADGYLPDGRTPAHSATVRTVFIIGPDKKLRLTMSYPMSVGRNFAEILRALDAVQATDGVLIATPANWVPGQRRRAQNAQVAVHRAGSSPVGECWHCSTPAWPR